MKTKPGDHENEIDLFGEDFYIDDEDILFDHYDENHFKFDPNERINEILKIFNLTN